MDLDGKITGPHVPKQPHEPEFFDRIKLLPLKHKVSEGEASDEGRHDVSDEAAREDGASHGASQNVRVSLRCGGEVIGSSRVKIPPSEESVSSRVKSQCQVSAELVPDVKTVANRTDSVLTFPRRLNMRHEKA
jgi:hypothetical protein